MPVMLLVLQGDGMVCGDGSFSELATFSFHPVKNITTAEGGAIVTSNENYTHALRSLRHHGIIRGARVI